MRLKSELYLKEQNILEDKLITILNLDNNKTIILYDLDNDIEKQNKILELIPEIRKYYNFTNIAGVRNTNIVNRPWLSIIRHLTKRKFNMLSADYRLYKNNELIRTKKYVFLNKDT
jgi:hypothetical protein